MDTVTIGCRFPNGYVLEVGLQTVVKTDRGLVTRLIKTPSYQRVVLQGTHGHVLHLRRQGIQTPSMLKAEPFINRNVPKFVWEQWNKEHPNSWAVSSGNLFEVVNGKDAANVKAASMDAMARPAILQPLDSSKKMVLGPNGETVEISVKKED